MNKKLSQGVVVGALALFLTLMVGYALFSQNLTIAGTAKAEGKFEITPTCTLGVPSDLEKLVLDYQGISVLDENGYGTDPKNNYCTVTGNTVTYATELKWYGARRYVIVKIENTGTIDATIPPYVGNTTNKYCVDGYDFATRTHGEQNGTFEESECDDQDSDMIRKGVLAFQDAKGNLLDENNEEIMNHLDENQENFILKPGEAIYKLYESILDNKAEGLNQTNFNIRYNFSETYTANQYVK